MTSRPCDARSAAAPTRYFLSDEAPRAIIPSATANTSADNKGRFSASDGAVCASSDANCGVAGLGAGGGGAGRRPTTSGNKGNQPQDQGDRRDEQGGDYRPIQRRQPEEQGGEKRNHHNEKKNRGDEPERGGNRNPLHGGLRLLLRVLLRQTDDVVSHSA